MGDSEGGRKDAGPAIPPEYMREFDECFRLIDKHNTGQIDINQLGMATRALGLNLTATEFETLMEEADPNRTGFIKYDAFCEQVYSRLSEIDEFNSLKQAFLILDKNEEGFIPAERFKKMMMTLGDPMTEKEAKEITKMGDLQKKKMILYMDLISALLR